MEKTYSEPERLTLLINTLEGGNAKSFADKTGILPSTISRIRAGKLRLISKVDTILRVYPSVSREWLETGEGYPGDISMHLMRDRYERLLQEKERQIAILVREIELLQEKR